VFFSLVDATLSKLQRGCVRLDFGSTRRVYGRPDDGLEAAITVHDGSFFRDVVLHGEVGLGQSYVARKWSSSDTGKSGSKKSPRHRHPVLRIMVGR